MTIENIRQKVMAFSLKYNITIPERVRIAQFVNYLEEREKIESKKMYREMAERSAQRNMGKQ